MPLLLPLRPRHVSTWVLPAAGARRGPGAAAASLDDLGVYLRRAAAAAAPHCCLHCCAETRHLRPYYWPCSYDPEVFQQLAGEEGVAA